MEGGWGKRGSSSPKIPKHWSAVADTAFRKDRLGKATALGSLLSESEFAANVCRLAWLGRHGDEPGRELHYHRDSGRNTEKSCRYAPMEQVEREVGEGMKTHSRQAAGGPRGGENRLTPLSI